jgi:hypothetical protein
MQTAADAIVHSITITKRMGRRFIEDLTPPEYLHRCVPNGNCTAWLLGHLAISNRRAATMLGATDLPALPDGFEKRFSRDESAPAATDFGDVSQLLPIFEQTCDLLIDTVQRATPERLNAPLDKPSPMFKNAGEMAAFISLHSAVHVGQITMIRRSLGRPPII